MSHPAQIAHVRFAVAKLFWLGALPGSTSNRPSVMGK